MAFGLTEPDAGSNSHNVKTTATNCQRVGAVLGRSTTSRRSIGAMPSLSSPVTPSTPPIRSRSCRCSSADRQPRALVPADRDLHRLADRQFTVFFDDVEVPAENLIGGEGDGLKVASTGLNTERILTSSLCTGVGRYALARPSATRTSGQVWSTPIGAHQGVAIRSRRRTSHVAPPTWSPPERLTALDAGEPAGELANMPSSRRGRAWRRSTSDPVHGGNSTILRVPAATYLVRPD